MSLDIALLESSFAMLAPRAPELAERFYSRLFEHHPAVRALFPGSMRDQQRHLIGALVTIVKGLRDGQKLDDFLRALAQVHAGYGVAPEHYPIVGENLLAVMRELAGSAWNDGHERAWADAYAAIQAIIYDELDDRTGG